MPRDPRGIVLLCGYVAAAALGLFALLTPPGDPIGWAYLALAAMGYFFMQTRGVATFLWLLVAAGGVAIGLAGGPSGWVEFVLGVALALVALAPLPAVYRLAIGGPAAQLTPTANGDSSRFVEVLQTRTSTEVEESAVAITAPGIEPADGSRLQVRCLGQLHLRIGQSDLAPGLEDRPVLAFLFKYLLARNVVGEPPVGRNALGDELSPGVPESSQRKRLRKQLYDLQKDIPLPIAALIHASRTQVWLDLDGADSDLAELRELADRIRLRGSMIDADLAGEIQAILQENDTQEFLPAFEELENKVNGGRGTAGQTVAQARQSIANLRAELVRALAEYQDAINRPEAAIPHLQAALEALPARQDLARLLVVAYLKTGQSARASELRRQFALKQE